MPFTFTMPKLSPTMEEGIIAKWHKKEGDKVASGELIIEVTTDKATVEHHALDEGYLRKILVKEGGAAQVNEAIAVFTEKKTESIANYTPESLVELVPDQEETPDEKPTQKTKVSSSKTTHASVQDPGFMPVPPLENYDVGFAFATEVDRIAASPLAKKIAKEKGLDLGSVKGSGPSGRIVERDLEKAAPSAKVSYGVREKPQDLPGSYDREPLTPMRAAIGRKLQQAKMFIPHFYLNQTVRADRLLGLRQELKGQYDFHVTVNDFILRATALALKEHPRVNSGFDSTTQEIIRYRTVDLAVAVGLEDGLITPIIRYADFKKLGELSQEVRALAAKAKAGKLQPEEFEGGSFTLSNLGMYGINSFQAIINPPQAAILAVGAAKEAAVVEGGSLKPGHIMELMLSCDHRVIDGADGAAFLRTLANFLENPAGLLV